MSNGAGVRKLDPKQAPISTALGVLGMPGMTAYVGLLDFGNPKSGETVVVSAASGAVGSVVGQIAKIKGCRAVGIAGGKAKCDYVVDELGLDTIDRRILRTIVEKYEGGPVGLDTIAVSVSEDPETVEDVYEPFLMQLGFLARTPRGRVATKLAYEHLGLVKASSGEQPRLF